MKGALLAALVVVFILFTNAETTWYPPVSAPVPELPFGVSWKVSALLSFDAAPLTKARGGGGAGDAIIVLAMHYEGNRAAAWIVVSVDGGNTWTRPVLPATAQSNRPITKIEALIRSTYHPNRIYALAAATGDGTELVGAVFVSHDEGRSWSRQPHNNYFIELIEVRDPAHERITLWAKKGSNGQLLYSNDDGSSWHESSQREWSPMGYNPSSGRFYFGTRYSDDGGQTFTQGIDLPTSVIQFVYLPVKKATLALIAGGFIYIQYTKPSTTPTTTPTTTTTTTTTTIEVDDRNIAEGDVFHELTAKTNYAEDYHNKWFLLATRDPPRPAASKTLALLDGGNTFVVAPHSFMGTAYGSYRLSWSSYFGKAGTWFDYEGELFSGPPTVISNSDPASDSILLADPKEPRIYRFYPRTLAMERLHLPSFAPFDAIAAVGGQVFDTSTRIAGLNEFAKFPLRRQIFGLKLTYLGAFLGAKASLYRNQLFESDWKTIQKREGGGYWQYGYGEPRMHVAVDGTILLGAGDGILYRLGTYTPIRQEYQYVDQYLNPVWSLNAANNNSLPSNQLVILNVASSPLYPSEIARGEVVKQVWVSTPQGVYVSNNTYKDVYAPTFSLTSIGRIEETFKPVEELQPYIENLNYPQHSIAFIREEKLFTYPIDRYSPTLERVGEGEGVQVSHIYARYECENKLNPASVLYAVSKNGDVYVRDSSASGLGWIKSSLSSKTRVREMYIQNQCNDTRAIIAIPPNPTSVWINFLQSKPTTTPTTTSTTTTTTTTTTNDEWIQFELPKEIASALSGTGGRAQDFAMLGRYLLINTIGGIWRAALVIT